MAVSFSTGAALAFPVSFLSSSFYCCKLADASESVPPQAFDTSI